MTSCIRPCYTSFRPHHPGRRPQARKFPWRYAVKWPAMPDRDKRLLLGFGLRQFSMHPAQLLGHQAAGAAAPAWPEVKAIADARILRTERSRGNRSRQLLDKLNA
jgi:hypothetical protein